MGRRGGGGKEMRKRGKKAGVRGKLGCKIHFTAAVLDSAFM